MLTTPVHVLRISFGFRPTATQWLARIFSFRAYSVGETPGRFHQSACLATIRSVSFSPPPPIMMGGTGTGFGLQTAFEI